MINHTTAHSVMVWWSDHHVLLLVSTVDSGYMEHVSRERRNVSSSTA